MGSVEIIMSYFIQRTYIDDATNEKSVFENLLNNEISVILGEPASGKTYQLEKYKELNPIKSIFVELMFIDDDEQMNGNVDVVLLDSVDEALSKNDSDKALIRKLSKYIKKCREINLDVKFIITCRYVEWKEIFEEELKAVDKDLKIFYIEELSKENINEILKQKNVNEKEFWEFIEQNYLEQLLKNILIVIYLIDNFDKYRGKLLKYFEIYQEIIKEHLLLETDNERKRQLLKLSPDKMFAIASSIATYMMLNRKRTISIENINKLVSELYKLNNIEITGEELNIIFDTALFSGNRENTRFFHKSIQEYLTAYFINAKQLDVLTIKKIFAFNYGFYDEFEEVIIYLTNIEANFFKHFIDFDPLIFRRHPYLSKEEQTVLLGSMLNILQKERQKAWGKWEYIENSSLVKLNSVDSIDELVRKNININDVDRELFLYLVSILEHNYLIGLEDIIFEILENIKSDKHLCTEYMKMNHITNMEYNKRLFYFIVANDLIDYQENYLYLHIFHVLYKHVEFKELIALLQNFSEFQKHQLLEIDVEDILFWFNTIMENHERESIGYSDEQISCVLFMIFKNYQFLEDKSILETIDELLESNLIHVTWRISEYDKDDFRLDFNDIKNDFWSYFFNQKSDDRCFRNILDILEFYTINLEVMNDIFEKYPIQNFKEHYSCLRHKIEGISDLLMKNREFEIYMEDMWAKQREQEKKWRDKQWERQQTKEKKEEQKIYENAINSLTTQSDILNVYLIAKGRHHDEKKTYEKLREDLGDKYQYFVDLTKKEFQNDELYLTIKDKLSTHRVYYFSMLYNYLFSNISNDEIDELIATEEEYKKLFWHTLSNGRLLKDYFLYISKKNIGKLISLSIEVLSHTLKQNEFTKSSLDYQFIDLFKKLEIFDIETLQYLIEEIKQNLSSHLSTLNMDSKNYFTQIIAINPENYEFIKELCTKDVMNFTVYFEYLFAIDKNRAFDDFIALLYPKGNNRLIFSTSVKVNFLKPVYQFDKFDVLNVCPIHRKRFKSLMALLYKIGTRNLYSENVRFILENYFDFFHEYYHPKGGYSPDIYDNMYDVINNILTSLGEDISKISLLEELKDSPNIKLQTRIKRQLEIAYNLQLKNREDNKDYKNILDSFVPSESDNRFFDYEKLKDDLIEISLQLMASRQSIVREIEDLINDRFRDALIFKTYRIADQSRGGESQSGKSVGERDLVVQNKESGVAESGIEAFILESDTASIINDHYDKLINKYDTSGNRCNFILVYSKVKDFEGLWDKYQKHFPDFTIKDIQKDNLKVGLTEKNNMQIIHLFINFYSNNTNQEDNRINITTSLPKEKNE